MLRVAVLELPARFGDPEAAWRDADALLQRSPCDLAVLPECAITGYCDEEGNCDLTSFAEPLEGPTVARARELARSHDTALVVPLIERDGDRLFNACMVVSAKGQTLHHYRKRHPWFPETWATHGDLPYATFELLGVRLSLAICYDVHFLEDEAASVLEASDALLFPSAWVDGGPDDLRGPIFERLATHFRLTVVNANWGMGSPRVLGQGASRVVTPEGEALRTSSQAGRAARIDITPGTPAPMSPEAADSLKKPQK